VHKLPADLRKALIANSTALDAWKDITPLARNEFICWVEDAKQEMTRERRIRRTQEQLEEGQRRPCCWPAPATSATGGPGTARESAFGTGHCTVVAPATGCRRLSVTAQARGQVGFAATMQESQLERRGEQPPAIVVFTAQTRVRHRADSSTAGRDMSESISWASVAGMNWGCGSSL
jgi:hypothetical protein